MPEEGAQDLQGGQAMQEDQEMPEEGAQATEDLQVDLAHRGVSPEGAIKLPVLGAEQDYESLKGTKPVVAIFVGRDASDTDDPQLNVDLNSLCQRVKGVDVRLFYHWKELCAEDDIVPQELQDQQREVLQCLSFSLKRIRELCDLCDDEGDCDQSEGEQSILSRIKECAQEYEKQGKKAKSRYWQELHSSGEEPGIIISLDDTGDIPLSERDSSVFLGAFRVFDSQPQKEPSNFRGLFVIVRAGDGFLGELEALRKNQVQAQEREQEDEKLLEWLNIRVMHVRVKDSKASELGTFSINDFDVDVGNVCAGLADKIQSLEKQPELYGREISESKVQKSIFVTCIDETDLGSQGLHILSDDLDKLLSGKEDVESLTVVVKVDSSTEDGSSTQDERDMSDSELLVSSLSRASTQQSAVADRLLDRTERLLGDKYKEFKDVSFMVLVPTFNTLREQTKARILKDVHQYGFQEATNDEQRREMDKRVLCYQLKKNRVMPNAWIEFRKKCLEQSDCLFVIVADECHWGINKGGAHDLLINNKELNDAPNFLVLLVSATPYNVLTKHSRIPDKEVFFGIDERKEELHVVEWFSPGQRHSSPYRGLEWYLSTVPSKLRHERSSKAFASQGDWTSPSGMIRADKALRVPPEPKKDQPFCRESAVLVDYAFSLAFFSVCAPAQDAGETAVGLITQIASSEVTLDKAKQVVEAIQDLRLQDNLKKGLSDVKRFMKFSGKERRVKQEETFMEMICDMERAFDERLNSLGEGLDDRAEGLRTSCAPGQSGVRLTETDRIVGDLLDERTGNMKIMRVYSTSGGLLCGHFLHYARDQLFEKKPQSFFKGQKLENEGRVSLPPFGVIEDFGSKSGKDSDIFSTGFARDPCFKDFVLVLEQEDDEHISQREETIAKLSGHLKLKNGKQPSRGLQYEDLDGLPCVIILVEKGRMGDTFPQSLDCLDLRMRASENLSTFVQEIGRLCRYPRTAPCKSGGSWMTAVPPQEKEKKRKVLSETDHFIITFESLDDDDRPFHKGACRLDFSQVEAEHLKQPGDAVAVMRYLQPAQTERSVGIDGQVFEGFALHVEPWEARKQHVPRVIFSGKGNVTRSSEGVFLQLEGNDSSLLELFEGDVVSVCDMANSSELDKIFSFSIKKATKGPNIEQGVCYFPDSDLEHLVRKTETSACFIVRDSASLKVLMRTCINGGSIHKVANKIPYVLVPNQTMTHVKKCVAAHDEMLVKGTPHLDLELWKHMKPGPLDAYVTTVTGKTAMSDFHKYRKHSAKLGPSATNTSYDHGNTEEDQHKRRLLLSAECQIGKTGVYCAFLTKLMHKASENKGLQEELAVRFAGAESLSRSDVPGIKWALPYWKDIQDGFTKDWSRGRELQLTRGKYHRKLRFVRLELLFKACLRAKNNSEFPDTCPMSEEDISIADLSWTGRYKTSLEKKDAVSSEMKTKLLEDRIRELQEVEPPVKRMSRVSTYSWNIQVTDPESVRKAIDWDVKESRKGPNRATVYYADCGDDPLQFEPEIERIGKDVYKWTPSRKSMQTMCWNQQTDPKDTPGGRAGASKSDRPAGPSPKGKMCMVDNPEQVAKAYGTSRSAQQPRVFSIKSKLKCGDRTVRFRNAEGKSDDRAVELAVPAEHAKLFAETGQNGCSVVDSFKDVPWIFTPSYRRHGEAGATPALLNRNGALQNQQWLQCIQVLVVRQHDEDGEPEFKAYQDACGSDYVVLKMPCFIDIEGQPECHSILKGIGFARLTCQLVAHALGLDKIWMVDDNVQFCMTRDIEPLKGGGFRQCSFLEVITSIERQVLGFGDNDGLTVPISCYDQRQKSLTRKYWNIDKKTQGHDDLHACKMHVPISDEPEEIDKYADPSKERAKKRVEFSGELKKRFAVVGMLRDPRQQGVIDLSGRKPFKLTHSVYSFFLLNVKGTVEARALYPAISFWEDIEFNQICREKGLVVLKCSTFFHRKKDLQPRALTTNSSPAAPSLEMRHVGSLTGRSDGNEESLRLKRAEEWDDVPEPPALTQEECFVALRTWVDENIGQNDKVLPFPDAQAGLDEDDDNIDSTDMLWDEKMKEWCQEGLCDERYERQKAEQCLEEVPMKKLMFFLRKNFDNPDPGFDVLKEFLGNLARYKPLKTRLVPETCIDVIFPLRFIPQSQEPHEYLNQRWGDFLAKPLGKHYDGKCELFAPMLAGSKVEEILIRPTCEQGSDPSMLVLQIILNRKSNETASDGALPGMEQMRLDEDSGACSSSAAERVSGKKRQRSPDSSKGGAAEAAASGSADLQTTSSPSASGSQTATPTASNGRAGLPDQPATEAIASTALASPPPQNEKPAKTPKSQSKQLLKPPDNLPAHVNDKDKYLAYALDKLIESGMDFKSKSGLSRKFVLSEFVQKCCSKDPSAFPETMISQAQRNAPGFLEKFCLCRPQKDGSQVTDAEDLSYWMAQKKNVLLKCWLNEMVNQVRTDLSRSGRKDVKAEDLLKLLWPKSGWGQSPVLAGAAAGGASKGGQPQSSSQGSLSQSSDGQKRAVDTLKAGAGQGKQKVARSQGSTAADAPADETERESEVLTVP